MLKKLKNEPVDGGVPTKTFALKMRWRLQRKSWSMDWSRFSGGVYKYFSHHHLKFAGVIGLIFLTLTGSVGVYAYSSPDVNVLNPLYPVKQGLESTELYFAGTPHARIQINLKHALNRMAEAEVLAERLKKSVNPKDEEYGVDETLTRMEIHMDSSLANASEEDDTSSAQETINNLRDDFNSVDQNLAKLEVKDHLKNRILIQKHLNSARDFAKNKLQNFDQADDEIKTAIKEKRAKVILIKISEEQIKQDPTVLNSGVNNQDKTGER